MMRRYAVQTSIDDLSAKAWTVSELAGESAGRIRLLTPDALYELQELTDAQIIYVDREMNASLLMPDNAYALPEEFRTGTDYDLASIPLDDPLDKRLVERILGGERIRATQQLRLLDASIVLCGAPVYDLSEKDVPEAMGAVILSRRLEDVWNGAQEIVLIFAAAGCISVLLSLIPAWFLSRRIAKPVLEIAGTARGISEGSYGLTTDAVYSSRELDELGRTLNALSLRLDSAFATLSNEKSKLEQILRGIGEGIIAVDRSGYVLHHNAAAIALTQAPPSDPLSAPALRAGDTELLLQRAMNERRQFSTGWTLSDGRIINANTYPVFDEAGENTIGAVALMRDVSESARLEQMRRDYIANISHELRTPLTGIRGMIEPLIDGVIEDDEEKQGCYRIIYQETVRLQKLIGDMLDMSRLQDGRVEIALERMDVGAICRTVAERMQRRAQETGVALRVQADENDDLFATGNEDRIMQVLVILLDNAFSFTPAGGEIRVLCTKKNGHVEFSVRDTGTGIDPRDLPYIWERFFKADRSRMRTGGTGLGLAIAKLAVEHMGGAISVESVPGVGSSFTVSLPE
ncbi:MAG: ATP-binding protein [Eubacteriales bacterium]|nr:ATP-binding protein [Eubacteriales bacterium]